MEFDTLEKMLYRYGVIARPFGSQLGEKEPTKSEKLSQLLMSAIADQLYPVVGVDVSRYQGVIDWGKLEINAYFAIIQSSYGSANIDSAFKINLAEAQKRNVGFGLYHYLKPDKDFKKTAQLFYSVWKDSGSQLPPSFDLEENDGLDKNALNNWMEKFLKEFFELVGNDKVVGLCYSSKSFMDTYVMTTPTFDWPKGLDWWIANWTTGAAPALPTVFSKFAKPKTWKIWQYSSTGVGSTYGAQSPRIDLDRYYASLAQFNAEYGLDLQPRPVPAPDPTPTPEPDPAPTPGALTKLIVHTPGGLNLRSGPGTNYPVVGGLPYQTIVTPLDIDGSNSWVEVEPGKWACVTLDSGGQHLRFMERAK